MEKEPVYCHGIGSRKAFIAPTERECLQPGHVWVNAYSGKTVIIRDVTREHGRISSVSYADQIERSRYSNSLACFLQGYQWLHSPSHSYLSPWLQ